jgi:hypothetical protein
MAYIGKNLVGVLKENRTVVTSTGDGSASLELNETPGSVNNVLVFLDGIRQQPTTDYTVSGSMLTFTTGPQTGVKIVAIVGNHSGVEPKKGSVTTRKIVDGAVTGQKLADGSIPASKFTGDLPAIDGSNLLGVHIDTIHKSPNDPAINTNTIDGQAVTLGQIWVNTTSGEMYICTDVTENAQHWMNVGAGEGDYSNVPPTNPTNTGVFQNVTENATYNFTFTGATDPDGSVTHYMVDNISPVGALTVAAAEVAATTAHTFTASAVDADTPVTFRVRAKDNNGAYSSGVTVSMNVTNTPLAAASGGDIDGATDGNFKYHVFNNSGTFTVSLSDATFEYLVVAGGGGGGCGWNAGGGGGAGGYLTASSVSLNNASYTVTVGGPGARGIGSTGATNGADSVLSGSGLSTVTSIGGGFGGNTSTFGPYSHRNGAVGGSGGGGGGYTGHGAGGAGTAGQGNAGGAMNANVNGGGGGGGASAAGQTAPSANNGGYGGAGSASSITGSSVTRSGGGGGGAYSSSGYAAGGNGGGGNGGSTAGGTPGGNTGSAGTVNTGGGGGGGNYNSSSSPGSAGGKGVVIIRYRYQ